MKKALVLIFACLFLFAAGCKKDNGNTVSHSVDIAFFADTGSMPDASFKVGDTMPEETGESDMFTVENGKESFASSGDFCYYFDLADTEKKIYAVVGFSGCYGFDVGAISVEITKVLAAQGIQYTEREPAAGELFFLPAAASRTVIECTSLKHPLLFVFEDNALCAAAVY